MCSPCAAEAGLYSATADGVLLMGRGGGELAEPSGSHCTSLSAPWGMVLFTWGVPVWAQRSLEFFGSFGVEFESLMQPIVLEDLQASSPWQLSLNTKHHMAFSEGEGMNRAEKVNLCLWWCLSSLSDWSMGRWKHGVLSPGHGFC